MVLTSTVENQIRQIQVILFDSIQSAMGLICSTSPPDLIVLEVDPRDPVSVGSLSQLKEDPYVPQPHRAGRAETTSRPSREWDTLLFEDYIWRKSLQKDIQRRVNLCILRSERIVEINPLTRLPGNISINREIQERIDRGEPFALAWADLDQFKPLNDKYGFSRGDDIISITGRLILSTVKEQAARAEFRGSHRG